MNEQEFENLLGKEVFQKASKSKLALDEINYKGLYQNYESGKLFLPNDDIIITPKDEISNDNCVAKAFEKILGKTRVKQNVHIGVISNGVHSFDFLRITADKLYEYRKTLFPNHKWNNKKVMLVFEAPASNLNCSYGYRRNCNNGNYTIDQYVNNYQEHENIRDCLSNIWWRLDDTDCVRSNTDAYESYKENPHTYMGKMKVYGNLVASIILNYGLANLYTTNLFRFELFNGNNNREKFLGFDAIEQIYENQQYLEIIQYAYDEVFKSELEAFDPDVILATSKPYKLLNDTLLQDEHRDKLVKILHPTAKIADEFRLACNVCDLSKKLLKHEIISNEQAEEQIISFLNTK